MRRFILLVFVGIFLTRSDSKKETQLTVCHTQECKKMSNIMLENMNKSVDPCDNFYEYACGKWSEHNPIPDGLHKWNTFSKLQKDINHQIIDILDSGFKDSDFFPIQLAKRWYKSCMDTEAMDKQGLDPLISTISRLGGWPMVMDSDEWDEREYIWQKVDDQYMRLTGRNTFHDVIVKRDIFNDDYKIYIDTPHLPPGSDKLRSEIPLDENKSDEDSNDDGNDSQGSESEGEDDNENYYDYYDNESGSSDVSDLSDDEDYSHQGSGSGDHQHHYDYENDYGSGDRDEDKYNGSGNKNNDYDDNHGSGYIDNDDDDDHGNGYEDDNDASDDRENHNDDNDGDNGHVDDDSSDYIDIDNNNDDSNKQIGDSEKKIEKIKIGNKIVHGKKLVVNRQEKNNIRITEKHNGYRMKKQRQVLPIKVESKRGQRFIRREKISARKNKRNHIKRIRQERRRRTFDNVEMISSVALRINGTSMEETDDERGTTMRQKYADYISKVARVIAEKRETKVVQDRLDKDIKNMIDFQLELIKIIPNQTYDKSNVWNTYLTLNDFQKWYDKKRKKNLRTTNGKIDLPYKIEELFDEAHVSMDKGVILEVSSNYFESLISLLDKTSSRTILNYIHWNFISKIIHTTTNEMRKLYYSWKNEQSSSRSFICASSPGIKHILAYEFVRKYFSDDIANTAFDILEDIEKEMEYLIKQSHWMENDEYAKKFALAKLKHMKKLIGYPDWYKNSTIVKQQLKGFIVGKSYYENALSYRRYFKWKELRNITQNVTETISIDPTVVNSFFIPWKNAITIAAADFQSPFFAYDRPESINFGIIGFIMAHEVNHGFDSTGYKFDKNGDYLGWLPVMAASYVKKADCFVKQFDNYTIDETSNTKITNYGTQTVSGNIADTMGLQAIFKAYQRRENEREKTDSALPGMENFTNNQLFFLSFANLHCEAIKPDYFINNLIEKDVHSTGRLRVIGSVSNSEDFAKAYNCPLDSPMNPKEKCNIWK